MELVDDFFVLMTTVTTRDRDHVDKMKRFVLMTCWETSRCREIIIDAYRLTTDMLVMEETLIH